VALSSGTRLGAYEILTLLGSGGMGEVYRARDLKLQRDVAIKVLPQTLRDDPERVARFEREAKTLAVLSHPNIAHIHGFEDSTGTPALVMELVEGPTLADRIAKGPIPLDEALAIAKQMAEGLEAAHEQGIIHRDLKPANIKVRDDGTVKILDFGLAKALEPATAGRPANVTASPTITTPAMMSSVGVILGTAAYMSPEQAKGRAADKRSDIWAFGCVVFEMLTGRRAFPGDDLSETLAAVIRSDPDWVALSAETPAMVRRLLRRCLQKDARVRFQHIGDARLEIEEAQSASAQEVRDVWFRSRARPMWGAAVALVLLIGGLLAADLAIRVRSASAAPELHVDITTPTTVDRISFALSPDGRNIVFSAMSEGRSVLWLRSLESGSLRPIRGTEFGSYPFWSPDNRSIGFFGGGKLKRVDVEGGSAQILADAPIGRGGSWNRDGVIVFAQTSISGIVRIPAAGGKPIPVTRIEAPTQSNHRFPQFLPDGRHFLYFARASGQGQGVYVGDLQGSGSQRLLSADAAAVFAAPGSLLFVRQGSLFAQPFDPVRLTLFGSPVSLADSVSLDDQVLVAPISASAVDSIAYRTGRTAGQRRFVWFDRSGNEIRTVTGVEGAPALNPAFTPDNRRAAVNRAVDGNTDIWLLDMDRGLFTRFTFDASIDSFPLWSPEGRRIVFNSNRTGVFDFYVKPAGGGSEQLLLATPQVKAPSDWSLDGRFLLYRSLDPETSWDLWALPLDGDHKPFPVVRTPFEERDGQFSPDGKWIAYQSDESGQFEIHVQSFPSPDVKEQVSTNGGAQVRWRRDGKELYYVGLDGRLMAVPIRLEPESRTIKADSPIPLFATHIGGALQGIYRQQYVVSPDGQRFLMNTVTEEPTGTPITVILNWKPKS
jgi:eukaryotic-like serine/threonine-protein kinase